MLPRALATANTALGMSRQSASRARSSRLFSPDRMPRCALVIMLSINMAVSGDGPAYPRRGNVNYHPNIEDDYHSYIPRSKPLPAGPARAIGIGRDPGNGRVLFVTFDRPPT